MTVDAHGLLHSRILFEAKQLARSASGFQTMFLNEFVAELRRVHETEDRTKHHSIAVSNDLHRTTRDVLADVAMGNDGAV